MFCHENYVNGRGNLAMGATLVERRQKKLAHNMKRAQRDTQSAENKSSCSTDASPACESSSNAKFAEKGNAGERIKNIATTKESLMKSSKKPVKNKRTMQKKTKGKTHENKSSPLQPHQEWIDKEAVVREIA